MMIETAKLGISAPAISGCKTELTYPKHTHTHTRTFKHRASKWPLLMQTALPIKKIQSDDEFFIL